MPKPVFISFEGIDGSGKSTQAKLLLDRLHEQDVQAILVREPGHTPLGEHLRQFLKSQQPITPTAELFCFQAARAELVQSTIIPALNDGISVITDRYTDSTVAYQGAGRGLNLQNIETLNYLATQCTVPDMTFLLSIDPDEAAGRTTDLHSRYESQDTNFYRRVSKGYQDQAKRETTRIRVLDASLPITQISQSIWAAVARALNRTPA